MKHKSRFLTASIGYRLRELRNQRGISQEKLAELSGLHRTYIGACERGERNITIVNLAVICTNLGITLPEFFDNECFKANLFE